MFGMTLTVSLLCGQADQPVTFIDIGTIHQQLNCSIPLTLSWLLQDFPVITCHVDDAPS